ncbi:hypothetical protein LCGC14_2533050 [marine sediment metagenome]|uniref:Phage ABA sandwich domain-containing protein n=1 Tax=marine sediment metagenome TaxID=412755 RepID=A0A0F9D4J9_9ZZZZ
MKPTKEQIQWFWERCGWEVRVDEVRDASGNTCYPRSSWFNGVENTLPDIDLNNLFKYAVLKLDKWNMHKPFKTARVITANVWIDDKYAFAESDVPALALFWAIYKALGGRE